jgi:FkbM family methyltransferase
MQSKSQLPVALGKYSRAILVNSKNGLFAVDPEDQGVGLQLREQGEYGFTELEKLTIMMDGKSRVLVVGAHIGTLAIPLSQEVDHVVAIEANPHTFELLQLNILLNKVMNCSIHHIAANDQYEILEFFRNKVNSGGSKRKPKINDHMYTYDNPEIIKVKSAPLDQYLEGQQFNIVIMDIEGSEYFALRGMTRILAEADVLVMEFIPHHLKNVSGVKVEELVVLLQGFSTLTWAAQNISIDRTDFSYLLNFMYENDINDDGLIFQK